MAVFEIRRYKSQSDNQDLSWDILHTLKYSNAPDAKQIFDITIVHNIGEGQEKLEHRNLVILIEFSPTFSNATLSLVNQYWKQTYGLYLHEMIQMEFPGAPDLPTHDNETIIIREDDTYINFQLANSILTLILAVLFVKRVYRLD